jgi:acyl carrier protein
MTHTPEQILDDIVGLLQQVARDWEYDGPLTGDTRLFADLNFESLDLVVLGTAVQEHFNRRFPFTEFFAELGQRQATDLTVAEWVGFIHRHMQEPEQAAVAEGV